MKPNNSLSALVRIFAAPTLIALASLIGLVAALLGDDAFDIVSWIALSIPVIAIVWAIAQRRA